ncbi:GDP-mannose 4,6-dehydratase [Desulfopila sp. IMCC35008]|uniref:GDP-mannose 4,6-dehydratase n=1 Tax=Desulfopila sp. IMCC35008 TaxID=2653858 RepID=UPI0013D43E14|nr:GDP-mannose 4,6-dehydratase [Desulfopila sp. IMCC35008]
MKALVCGVSGQDGAYLAELLLAKGYEVYGASRDAQMSSFANLKYLGIHDRVKKVSLAINDFRSVLQVIQQVEPDEIYNLAGQSSVGLSFEQPVETLESISIGVLNLLEAIRFTKRNIKLYNAGSSEVFGDTHGIPADESTPFHPQSPYAVAKASAHWIVANYREAYGLFACTGILFNHESPLRPERFVTRKIISTACRIAAGSGETLHLGNIGIARDWGWAPEYVEAMWKMLQQEQPDDFVVATGTTSKLEEFIALAFSSLNLDWHDHVQVDSSLLRPSDILEGSGNPAKAGMVLEWKAQFTLQDVVKMMIDSEQTTK